MSESVPYAGLTPDCVLDCIESVGYRCDGRQLALNSYENRVYQVGIDDAAPVVAKFYRPGRWSDAQILEEHAYAQALADAEIPVVAPLAHEGATLHTHQSFRFAVYPRRGGRAPELGDPQVSEWIGRFIGRMHALGAVRPFEHRPALDIAAFGIEPRAFLIDSGFLPGDIAEAYRGTSARALDAARACFERAGDVASIRLHGDVHAGNVLWTDDGPHFVDLDDARMGPAVQDLWMLLSGDRASMTRQLSDVLAGYEDFCEFDRRELHLVEALRTLRIVHYAAWIARRWEDPAFPAAFTWFNTQRYWEEHILQLKEQIAVMEEAPLGPV
jgi:Ser/Thr protein kinase RdoA (MazF antagonist)